MTSVGNILYKTNITHITQETLISVIWTYWVEATITMVDIKALEIAFKEIQFA